MKKVLLFLIGILTFLTAHPQTCYYRFYRTDGWKIGGPQQNCPASPKDCSSCDIKRRFKICSCPG